MRIPWAVVQYSTRAWGLGHNSKDYGDAVVL